MSGRILQEAAPKPGAASVSAGQPGSSDGVRSPCHNLLRVVDLDRRKPTVLWSLNSMTSVPHPVWNNDWDGDPLQIGDYLLEGGENSWFYVIRLHGQVLRLL